MPRRQGCSACSPGKDAPMFSHRIGWAVALCACALTAFSVPAQDGRPRLSLDAATSLEKAKVLLQCDDVLNAILLLENQLPAGRQHTEYVQTTVEAYSKQLRRYQDEGKVTQA